MKALLIQLFVGLSFLPNLYAQNSYVQLGASLKADIRMHGTWFRKGSDMNCGFRRPSHEDRNGQWVPVSSLGQRLESDTVFEVGVSADNYTARNTQFKMQRIIRDTSETLSLEINDRAYGRVDRDDGGDCGHTAKSNWVERVFIDGKISFKYILPHGVNVVRVSVAKGSQHLLESSRISNIDLGLHQQLSFGEDQYIWFDQATFEQRLAKFNQDMELYLRAQTELAHSEFDAVRDGQSTSNDGGLPFFDRYAALREKYNSLRAIPKPQMPERAIALEFTYLDFPEGAPFPEGLRQSKVQITFEPMGVGLLQSKGAEKLFGEIRKHLSVGLSSNLTIDNDLAALLDFGAYLDAYVQNHALSDIGVNMMAFFNLAYRTSFAEKGVTQFTKAAASIITRKIGLKLLESMLPLCEPTEITLPIQGKKITVPAHSVLLYYLLRTQDRLKAMKPMEIYAIWDFLDSFTKKAKTYRDVLRDSQLRKSTQDAFKAYDHQLAVIGYPFGLSFEEIRFISEKSGPTGNSIFANLLKVLEQAASAEGQCSQAISDQKRSFISDKSRLDQVVQVDGRDKLTNLDALKTQALGALENTLEQLRLVEMTESDFRNLLVDIRTSAIPLELPKEMQSYYTPLQSAYFKDVNSEAYQKEVDKCLGR